MPNALLVYPEFPPSYWGFKYALQFVGAKSAMPPLGLLTIAAMFPDDYDLRVVDMNVRRLADGDLQWADAVFTSTMVVQRDSFYDTVRRCNAAGVPVVAGGPHPTTYHEIIDAELEGGVAHFVLGEVEETFADFLTDFEEGRAPHVQPAPTKPSVATTPLPRYDLIDLRDYSSMALQFSRGCPFDCEFCDITKLFGRVPRTKSADQMLTEFDLLYGLGWRGPVFLVDDNFIGNKRNALAMLPAVTEWQRARAYPFSLYTEASLNLARSADLMRSMVDAGFNQVFLGIESPNHAALVTTNKKQNTARTVSASEHLLQSVRAIQATGMEVSGGFIVGLDGDTEFDSHLRFIEEAGIPLAMVGLLSALKDTDLYHRLAREGRLRTETTGNNTDIRLNFEPELPEAHLIAEYRRILRTLYDPSLSNYFDRCLTLLRHWQRSRHGARKLRRREVLAFLRSLRRQLFSRQGPAYARFLAKVVWRNHRMLPEAVRLAVMGYHFEKVTSQTILVHDFRHFLDAELVALRARMARFTRTRGEELEGVRRHAQDVVARVRRRYASLHVEFRDAVHDAVADFQEAVVLQLRELGYGPDLDLTRI